jgi:hypothetical protein
MHRWPFIHQADTLKRITPSWCTFQNPAAGFTCLSNCHYQNQYRSERASDWTNTATPSSSHPLQPSSHLLSNVLVFISRLNKCLFLQHARTHTHAHTMISLTQWTCPNPGHFLPKAAPSILVARVIEVSVLVQQPNTLQTQDAGNICLHCAAHTYRQLVGQLGVEAVRKRNHCRCDPMICFKHSCIKTIYSSCTAGRNDCHLIRNRPMKSSVHSAPSRRPRALLP